MVAVRATSSPAGRRVVKRCMPKARQQRTALRRVSSAAALAALLAFPVLAAVPAQAYSSQQWALDYLKANQDWQVSKGANVTVAVIDSGVASIPDLNGQVLSGADFTGGTASSGNGRTDTDDGGHGTGMASIIVGTGTGVTGLAPSAKVLAVRVMTGDGGYTPQELAAAIQFAVQQHVGVINLSVGSPQSGDIVQQAISQAIEANIVVVAASGNESTSTVDFPAAYPGVVAVGAVDQNGQIWDQSNTGAQVALSAPGVQIYRDNNFGQQGTESGTSEATAYVSATAALIRSAHPDWTAGQVIRDLISTADPGQGQTAGQRSEQYGYGVIDPLKALQAAAPTDTSNPLLGSPGSGTSPGTGSTTGNASSTPAPAASSSNSSHTGLIIGVVVGIIILIGLILLVVALARRGRGGPKPPSGPGGQYGGGYQPSQPQQNPYQQQGQQNPYQQQNPYERPNPYQQRNPYQQPQPPQNPPYPQAPNQ